MGPIDEKHQPRPFPPPSSLCALLACLLHLLERHARVHGETVLVNLFLRKRAFGHLPKYWHFVSATC